MHDFNTFTLYVEGAVRLANGASSNQGRVEIYHSGSWGTVCDFFWLYSEANVVCRQLGYSRAKSSVIGGVYGWGSGRIWMYRVNCVGLEARLADCSFLGWGIVANCDHSKDVGVVCANGMNDHRSHVRTLHVYAVVAWIITLHAA